MLTEFLTSPAMGAVVALTGVWVTNRQASRTSRAQLRHSSQTGLRAAVADVLACEPDARQKCHDLFEISYAALHVEDSPTAVEDNARFFTARGEYIASLDRLRTLAIRASLYTDDNEIRFALDGLREIPWNRPVSLSAERFKDGKSESGETAVADLFRKLEAVMTLHLMSTK